MKFTDHEITAALSRYIDEYGWTYRLACKIINKYFDKQYTETELQKLHSQCK